MNACIIRGGGYSNVCMYILGVYFFCLIFIVCYKFCNYSETVEKHLIILRFLACVCCSVWLIFAFFLEPKIYPGNAAEFLRHNIPFVFYAILILLIAYFYIKFAKIKNFFPKVIWGIFYIVLAGVIFGLLYQPAIFNDGYNTIFHIHAYTNSIVNVLHGAPYSGENCSIYGHYALFFVFPVKLLTLFGISELKAFIALIAIIGCLTYFMIFYCIRKLVKNDFIYGMSIVASIWPMVQIQTYGQYYQMLPHRFFFPAMVLFMLILEEMEGKFIKYKNTLNWIIVCLAILWNFETGIVCGGVLIGSQFYKVLQKKESLKTSTFILCRLGISFVMSAIGAFVIVNVYNFYSKGTSLSLKEFIYPFGSETYHVEELRLPIPGIYGGYFFMEIIFLIAIVCMTVNMHKTGLKGYFIFSIALMGIGKMTYYMNRTAYANIEIIYIEMLTILTVFLDELFMWNSKREQIKLSSIKEITNEWLVFLGHLAVLLYSCLILASLTYTGMAIKNRSDASWNTDNMDLVCEEISKEVPEDVASLGQGVPELLANINRSSNLYITDWSDMNALSISAVENAMAKENCIFANVQTISGLKGFNEFTCLNVYNLPGRGYGNTETTYSFGLYVKDVTKYKGENQR